MRIDFHAHILPGADHGSDSLETSLRQLASAASVDVSVIVASAHFYPQRDSVARFLARRERCLCQLAAAHTGRVRILPGAEVALYQGMEQMEDLEKLCIGDSNVILLEMPLGETWSEQLLDTVYEIEHIRKLRPVMAHIDRYSAENVERLLSVGAAAQLNAESICALRTRRRCLNYVKRGVVWALGSDIHGASNAYQRFDKALALLGRDANGVMQRSAELLDVCLRERRE